MTFTEFPQTQMSDAQFAALPRYANGDVVHLYAAYVYFTDEQLAELTPDDAARVEAFDEAALADLVYLHELEAETGLDFELDAFEYEEAA